METQEYSKLAEVEAQMWWFHALHRNLLQLMLRFLKKQSPIVLDAGCGTGGLMRFLDVNISALTLLGLDMWLPACQCTKLRSAKPVIQGDVNCLPFADNSIDCIMSADVLYHEGILPEKALLEAFRCLRPEGILITNVPAYEWLRSYHDERVKTGKRFRRSEVASLLESSGFDVVYNTYWNTLLFPVMVLRRKVFKPVSGASDVILYPKAIEWFFRFIMTLEFKFLSQRGTFPFGGSILTVGMK